MSKRCCFLDVPPPHHFNAHSALRGIEIGFLLYKGNAVFDTQEKGNEGILTGQDAPETLPPGFLYTRATVDSS